MTTTPTPRLRTAVVFGGGGVAGIAWELGVVSTLLDRGIPLDDADLVVGTSAGSVVGTLLRLGRTGEALAEQLAAGQVAATAAPSVAGFEEAIAQAMVGATTAEEARAGIGRMARETPRPADDTDLVPVMREQLAGAPWPDRALTVCTVDATDGVFRPLDASSGVDLAIAVAASCSVPVVFPTVDVAGRATMDGGVRSGTNADLADDYDRVVVVSCGPEQAVSPLGPSLPQVVAARAAAGRPVFVVEADTASLAAFGDNMLSPAVRRPAAEAGRAQAARVADAVLAYWTAGV
ncbi:patatin-like phospholipase family protein [Frigoribacterium sp. 2-23]|uniref:patatin-like phospholipase family protein n=1 Tax=Frigoribacterium sp. 2-23 TaxID=3415006 RepID=UPI003C6FB747